MPTSYKELLAQREALEQAISQARQNEIASTVAKVRELVAEYGLTAQDIFPGRVGKSGAAKAVSKVAAKYRDPATAKLGPVAAKRLNGLTAKTAPHL